MIFQSPFRVAACVATLVAAISAQPRITNDPNPDRWEAQEDMSDEFPNDSSLNDTMWAPSFDGWDGRAPGAHSVSNVRRADGNLILDAKYEPGYSFPSESTDCNCEYQDFTTSVVKSKFTLEKGSYIEFKAKTAAGSILSSVFLQGANSEIGILESVGESVANMGSGRSTKSSAYCFTDTTTTETTTKDYVFPADLSMNFNVFGLHWSLDGKFTFYKNGDQFDQFDMTVCNDEPHHVVIATETMAEAGLPTDALDESFELKYVRVWKELDVGPPPCTLKREEQFSAVYTNTRMSREAPDLGYWSLFDQPYPKTVTPELCMKLCIATPDCVTIEWKPAKGTCVPGYMAVSSETTIPNNNWVVYSRTTICDDDLVDYSGCTTPAVDRFVGYTGKKTKGYSPPIYQNSLENCSQACVDAGLDAAGIPICGGFDFMSRKALCIFRAGLPVKGDIDSGNIKDVERWDFYDRVELLCSSDLTGCTTPALDRFSFDAGTKVQGFETGGVASTAQECAELCVAEPLTSDGLGPSCTGFEYHASKQKCVFRDGSSVVGKVLTKSSSGWDWYDRTTLMCPTSINPQ